MLRCLHLKKWTWHPVSESAFSHVWAVRDTRNCFFMPEWKWWSTIITPWNPGILRANKRQMDDGIAPEPWMHKESEVITLQLYCIFSPFSWKQRPWRDTLCQGWWNGFGATGGQRQNNTERSLKETAALLTLHYSDSTNETNISFQITLLDILKSYLTTLSCAQRAAYNQNCHMYGWIYILWPNIWVNTEVKTYQI